MIPVVRPARSRLWKAVRRYSVRRFLSCVIFARFYCSILVASTIIGAPISAADPYFEAAVDKIEQTLVRPADSYGLTITDTYSVPGIRESGHLMERYSFYTDGLRYQFHHWRYDPRRSKIEPYLNHLEVSAGDQDSIRILDISRAKSSLKVNVEPHALLLGQGDLYRRYPSKLENDAHPDEQPYQILVNPCFAPLKVAPLTLRRSRVVALPGEDECKVYEVRVKVDNFWSVAKLHFSLRHDHALAKSEQWIVLSEESPVERAVSHSVRTVEAWQELPDGSHVPARFVMQQTVGGEVTIDLVREITSPSIGNVDAALFDIAKIPEFQRNADLRLDLPRLKANLAEWRTEKKPSNDESLGRNLSWKLLFLMLNVAVFAVLALSWIYRRRSRRPAS